MNDRSLSLLPQDFMEGSITCNLNLSMMRSKVSDRAPVPLKMSDSIPKADDHRLCISRPNHLE